MTSTMKAFAINSYKPMGHLKHLEEVSVVKPSNPSGYDIIVKVKAVATNPIDYKRLANLGNTEAKYEVDGPLVVGWDASGVVEGVGPLMTLFSTGDEVMFAGDFFRAGAFAEESLILQLKISTNKSENTGKTILVTAGAGGVGSAAVQIAKNDLGLTVVGTASRTETTQFVKSRGADHVVSHREAYKPQLEKIGIESIDFILHCSDLTPEIFTEFTDIVKPFGSIASIWPSATVDLMQLFWKSINFSTELMFTRPGLKDDHDQIVCQNEILNKVGKFVEEGVLTSAETVTKELTVDNLREMLEIQASGKAIGKLTLSFAA